jgi:hypothetical protein
LKLPSKFTTHLLLAALSASLLAACSPTAPEISKQPLPAGAPVSRAFGIWIPSTASGDTCSKEIHDQYWTYGPDGKVYPSWHPPVDASGCSFGHEHGRDPKGSKLIALTLPFGYVNEQLSPNDPRYQRNEDHVGHKVEWANDIEISQDGRQYTKCDVLFKLHQGTHSPDALTNNLHELFYYASCGDGTKIQWRNLQAFGHPGKVQTHGCKDATKGIDIAVSEIAVGVAVPATSPDGGGIRRLPGNSCVEASTLVSKGNWSDIHTIREDWEVSVHRRVQPDPAKPAMSLDFTPYFQVYNPSRYFDPTSPNKVSRPLDLCFKRGDLEWRDDKTCDSVRAQATAGTMAYTDPRSPFNGADRKIQMNTLSIDNASGTTRWYSDVYGENLRTSPDASKGIILEQFIGSVINTPAGKDFRGPVLVGNYGHNGVHAPN